MVESRAGSRNRKGRGPEPRLPRPLAPVEPHTQLEPELVGVEATPHRPCTTLLTLEQPQVRGAFTQGLADLRIPPTPATALLPGICHRAPFM